MTQQGDVRLFQTNDGGDMSVTGGIVAMDGGLETAVYLSLFGGNENDSGGDGAVSTWWGNLSEIDTVRQYRSETQNLLRSIPATSFNLRRIEDAAARDLAWLISEGAASSVSVFASVQGLNTIRITVTIEALGETSEFVFAENWKAS